MSWQCTDKDGDFLCVQVPLMAHTLLYKLLRKTMPTMPKTRVLSNSELYNLGSKSQLFDDNMKKKILGVDIRPVILGDPAYPHLVWLMKAYPENINTPKWQRHFNYRLSHARMTVENTFGRWKGADLEDLARGLTWRLNQLPTLLQLHVLFTTSVNFFQEWLEVCNNIVQPENLPLPNEDVETQCESDATVVRDTLAQYSEQWKAKTLDKGLHKLSAGKVYHI